MVRLKADTTSAVCCNSVVVSGFSRTSRRRRHAPALLEDVTRLGALHVLLHVSWEKQPLLLQLLGCLLHCRHVTLVILVAFFERKARIAGSHPFRFRGFERHVLAAGLAPFVLAK